MSESSGDAYDRGHAAGEIAEQLRRHEAHFSRINGSIADSAEALEGLTLAVQRLADQATADASTRVATAKALHDAEVARRHAADRSWSPIAKTLAVIGAAVAVATLLLGAYVAVGR